MLPRAVIALVLVVSIFLLHARIAALRSQGLLAHDEAIALLTAAGKSSQAERLFQPAGSVGTMSAAELQSFLKPTPETSCSDVMRSLADYDIHPPLYFLVLRGLQRPEVDSQIPLRLLGTVLFLIAAWIADRWLWPDATPLARLLGFAWLTLSPVCIEVATELRQYAFVYLGVIVSLAGCVNLDRNEKSNWRAIALLALGPVILIYSHFGTAVWIGVLGIVVALTVWRRPKENRTLFAAVILAACLIAPLAIWCIQKNSRLGRSPVLPPSQWYSAIVLPFSQSFSRAWLSSPARWEFEAIGPVITLLVAAASGILAARGDRVDRLIAIAILSWSVIWAALLSAGRIPPHALAPKYLAPIIIGILALLVRSTRSTIPPRLRRLGIAALALSLISHAIGIRQLLHWPLQEQLVEALRETKTMVVSNPRRGFLLPLADKLQPESRVITAGQSSWARLAPLLPDDGSTLVEIGDRAASEELRAGLADKYSSSRVLRSEAARTITAYGRP